METSKSEPQKLRLNAYDLNKAMIELPIGGELEVPNRLFSEMRVRQKCTRLNEKGYKFTSSLSRIPGSMVITRLK